MTHSTRGIPSTFSALPYANPHLYLGSHFFFPSYHLFNVGKNLPPTSPTAPQPAPKLLPSCPSLGKVFTCSMVEYELWLTTELRQTLCHAHGYCDPDLPSDFPVLFDSRLLRHRSSPRSFHHQAQLGHTGHRPASTRG